MLNMAHLKIEEQKMKMSGRLAVFDCDTLSGGCKWGVRSASCIFDLDFVGPAPILFGR